MIKTFRLPLGWSLVVDTDQIFADDPGAGAPALLHAPGGQVGTLWCAQMEEECDGVTIPRAVLRELDALESVVADLLDA